SVAPRSLKRKLAQPSASSCRRPISPARYAARPNWNADEPCIRVRSRSKNAAEPAVPLGLCLAAAEPSVLLGVCLAAAEPSVLLGVCRAENSGAGLPWSWVTGSCRSSAIHLDDNGIALATSRADRRTPAAAAAPAQLEHERAEDPGARG